MSVEYRWRGWFENEEQNRRHAEGSTHPVLHDDSKGQLERHSLGWLCAREGDELVAVVNAAWDGAIHAARCDWLYVDLEDDLHTFYFDTCGFRPTNSGLIALSAG